MDIRPIDDAPFGARVTDFDCAKPGDRIDALRDALQMIVDIFRIHVNAWRGSYKHAR